MNRDKIIKAHFSELGKKSAATRNKRFRSKKARSDFYKKLGKKGLEKRWQKSGDKSSGQ